jgi:sterol 3beta-glucosyltransferase
MRWPRVNRKSTQESDLAVSRNPDPVREVTPDDLPIKTPPSTDPTDPGLSRMFSDAALYEKILTACPESLKAGGFFGADDQAFQRCIGGFNALIGQDLGGAEREISGRLAKLSVNNWVSPGDGSFASQDHLDEEPGEPIQPDDGKEAKPSPPPTLAISLDAPLDEPKLTPEEIVDLLEQEFGALAPLGEEKLLLEADAAFFKDVVILVAPSPAKPLVLSLTLPFPGRRSPYHA